MSTPTNKVVVTLKPGTDVDAFIMEMSINGNVSAHVPDRPVEVANLKPDSLYNVDFILTREEMDTLSQDSRVQAVRWGSKAENGIVLRKNALTGDRPYYRNTTWVENTDNNWGIPACNDISNPFTGTNLLTYDRPYTLDGSGVDIVVMDSGIEALHPDWLAADGVTSRLQQIDWWAASGQTGTMPPNFYTDVSGHGTNVASIAAGRLYGWAPGAHIYIMNILGENAQSRWPSVTSAINTIRLWHLLKPIDPYTGYRRPTIVNASWGYSISAQYFAGYNYRGGGEQTLTYDNSNAATLGSVGIVSSTSYDSGLDDIPTQVASVESDIQAAMEAGIIFVCSSGNDSYKQDISGGLDYNNYAVIDISGTISQSYYHRGNTPGSTPNMINIGAINWASDQKALFSKTGPGISIFSPGAYIAGACSTVNNLPGYPTSTYPLDTNYLNIKISGTSQASPQVCGVLATLLQARPYLTQNTALADLQELATSGRITDTGGGYTDFTSLQDAGNRYLYNPFYGSVVTEATVEDDSLNSTTIHGIL